MTATRWWPGINVRWARAPKSLIWITIWRSCTASPVRCRAGITAALSVGSTSPDVVALEARKAAERRGMPAGPDSADKGGRVVILLEHRSVTVPTDTRPLPSVDKYDTLLGRESS